ncbi:hypothetical protein SLS62_007054 [Diatrype stigma]|uniref:HMG box domain-containing protein n=1 Tax=Diatrype stigma TaxID=117547 RepID=A0AAN9YMH8_9PEZI
MLILRKSVTKIIAARWHALSPEEHKYWDDMEDEVAREHKRMYPDYKVERRSSKEIRRRNKSAAKTSKKASGSGNGTAAAAAIQPSASAVPKNPPVQFQLPNAGFQDVIGFDASEYAGAAAVPEDPLTQFQLPSAEAQEVPDFGAPEYGGLEFGAPIEGQVTSHSDAQEGQDAFGDEDEANLARYLLDYLNGEGA